MCSVSTRGAADLRLHERGTVICTRDGSASESSLVRIGARAVAPQVDPLARLQITHRLPRPLGLIVADESGKRALTERGVTLLDSILK